MKKHYQRLCSKGVCLILTTFFTLSVSTKLSAQEKLKITPDLTGKIVTKYNLDELTVFPVVQKEIEYKQNNASEEISKRLTFVIKGVSISSDELNGTFIKLSDEYRVALVDIGNKYIKEEVFNSSNEFDYDTSTMTRSYPLIQKEGTGEYYFIMTDNFITSLIKEQSEAEILALIHKLGYKEYENGGVKYIKSKTSEIRLDARTYQELKTNPNYITQLDNDQIKLSVLVKQTITHSKTLDKYLSIYNIKRSRMASADLAAWRNATKQADALNKQIYKISEKYDGNYSVMPLDKSYNSKLSNFVDNVLASKGVLGM